MITKNFEPKFYAVFSHAWMYFGANFQQSVGCHLVTKECWNLYIFYFSLGINKFWVATQEPIFLKDGLRCRNENLPAFSQGMDLYSKKISAKNLISCLRKSILKKCRSFIGGPGTALLIIFSVLKNSLNAKSCHFIRFKLKPATLILFLWFSHGVLSEKN